MVFIVEPTQYKVSGKKYLTCNEFEEIQSVQKFTQ